MPGPRALPSRRQAAVSTAVPLMLLMVLAPTGASAYAKRARATAGEPTTQSRVAEYALKAAFLYRFTAFVEWPADAPVDGPFVIGVLGEDPFGDSLREAVEDKTVGGRAIEIRRFSRAEQVEDCQLLFLATAGGTETTNAIEAIAGRGILTVGDAEGFAESGGVIRLFVDDGKIRFEINPAAAEAERLRVSSRLLQLARIVGSTASGEPRS